MSRNGKFSKETKISACKNYEKGKGSCISIGRSIGAGKSTVMRWYSSYLAYGPEAFDISPRNKSYTKEFKIGIVESYLSGEYSISEIVGKYNISCSMVYSWVNKYNKGIEIKDYNPKGDVYTMKSRKTTFEDRLEIVEWVIENDLNYKAAADKFEIKYALVYQWVQKYIKYGPDELKHKKKGPKPKIEVDETSLSEVEQLKLELEREKARRQRAEFRLEVLKKKEEFERKLHSRK